MQPGLWKHHEMSKKKFDALPPEVRKIIQDNSGESSSRQFGAYLDGEATRISNQIKASEPKNKLVSPSDALAAKWQAMVEHASEDWLKSVPNGKQIRVSYEDLLAHIKAGSGLFLELAKRSERER